MEMEIILKEYCDDEMRKLKQLCYPLFRKIGGISEKDYDDFYSIALDALADSILRYDPKKDCQFKTFLTGNVRRKFNTEIRDRNRNKRIPVKQIDSIHMVCSEDGRPLSEMIPSNFDTFEKAFGNNFNGTKVEMYIKKLSINQRKIVSLLCEGYKAKEIRELLHMNNNEYTSNLAAIQSYENVKILM